jgi:hypothetical protein
MKIEISKGNYKQVVDVTAWNADELFNWVAFKSINGFDIVEVA